MANKSSLAERIKTFRMSKEMNQRQAGVVLGVSEQTIQRIETGARGSDLTRARIENRLKKLTERESVAA